MSYNLVIVESPGKVATIAKYLNGNPKLKGYGKFIVIACYGHIRDLPKKSLGIDVNQDFKPTYEVYKEKEKVVRELVKKRKDAKFVWLATDADNEGAAISNSIKEVLKLKKSDYHRIIFREITPSALEYAITHPGDIDSKQVNAQETRRILDRLVGFKISPLLWKRYNGVMGLSAGRVQSAALNIICSKEKEVSAFVSKNYYSFLGDFNVDDTQKQHELLDLKLHDKDGKIFKELSKEKAEKLIKSIGSSFTVLETKHKQSKQKPDLPFITSTLQQEASAKFGMSIKRTMQVAQDLYEAGLITYMRTDSYTVSETFQIAAKQYIHQQYGEQYVAGDNEKKTKKSIHAQEAHEAIRPTNLEIQTPQNDGLGNDHKKLYDLIWKRFIAYFVKPAIFDEVEMAISEKSFLHKHGLYFLAVFKKIKFNGYLAVYGVNTEIYNFETLLRNINMFKVKCKSITAHNTWMSPPARYNESSLVKVLETEGIGRPSTYASIMAKLYEKQYIIKTDIAGTEKQVEHMLVIPGQPKSFKLIIDKVLNGSERGRLIPTDIGQKVLEFLKSTFNYIIDPSFTAHMEADLDKIENGSKTKLDVLKAFWSTFSVDVQKIEINSKKKDKETLKTDDKEIELNGITYKVRLARYGPVIQTGNKYISLKAYLKLTRKNYLDITEEDVRILTSVPWKVGTYHGYDVYLLYGAYGFYLKYNDVNVKLFNNIVMKFLKDGKLQIDDIEKSIEYSINKPSQL